MAGKNGEMPLAVTIGDPAGIGPEVILRAWLARDEQQLPPFIVLGDPELLTRTARALGMTVPLMSCNTEDAGQVFARMLPAMALSAGMTSGFGKSEKSDGRLVCEAISSAVDLVFAGQVSGIVTAPINKKALYDSGFPHPGHTEFLAALASERTGKKIHPVMMLAGPQLRTVPVTIHIALREVPAKLSRELVFETGMILASDLANRFGISRPRIAVSGLNPHAGEEGSMGMEDIEMIAPAVRDLVGAGINAFGPLPADTMFHAAARKTYDAALCMYHDQALIPAKTLAFDKAVNVTLGLPFIRTSPDHGTAYNIAGKGIANPSSMIAAIKMAGQMAISGNGKRKSGSAL
jgi:4-hydroxythreonine-4-phosphate dehydrogenase